MTTYSECKFKKDRIAFLRSQLKTDPRWAVRGLIRIHQEQTAEEQNCGDTVEHNGVGFTGVDGHILSSFADQVNRGRTMSFKQMALIYKKMPKYAAQLEKLAKPRTVGASVNPIRHLRDMHRSHCD